MQAYVKKESTDVRLNEFDSDLSCELTYYWCDADSRGFKFKEEILCLKSDKLLDFPISQIISTARKMLIEKGIDPKTVGILDEGTGY